MNTLEYYIIATVKTIAIHIYLGQKFNNIKCMNSCTITGNIDSCDHFEKYYYLIQLEI